jgi:hypothetical protein
MADVKERGFLEALDRRETHGSRKPRKENGVKPLRTNKIAK